MKHRAQSLESQICESLFQETVTHIQTNRSPWDPGGITGRSQSGILNILVSFVLLMEFTLEAWMPHYCQRCFPFCHLGSEMGVNEAHWTSIIFCNTCTLESDGPGFGFQFPVY